MDKKSAVLKDIANALNLSISTVSRALKSNPRISTATQEKVKRMAEDLGYDGGRKVIGSNLIGVIVPRLSYHLYAMAISGIESIVEQHGMHLIVCQSNESYDREKGLIKELVQVGVKGLICSLASETKDFRHFQDLKAKRVPLVFFNRQCDEIETHKVTIDNKRAAYEAVSHLISIGCNKIAYLGGPEVLQINRARMEGYKEALLENKLTLRKDYLIWSRFDRESTLSAARTLLYTPDYPDGILTFSDQIAISVMLAAKERGIPIPEKLSVIGFNNEPVDELLEPSLTSVDQPAFKMGAEAAQLCLKQMDDFNSPFEKIVLKSFLVVRNSTNRNRS